MRADLRRPSRTQDVKGSYEGYTYATETADLTIYGGDLTITIDWSSEGSDGKGASRWMLIRRYDQSALNEVQMISDLTDSLSGMEWVGPT